MKAHKKIVIMQAIFLVVILVVIYFIAPRANISVDGTRVKFASINANVVMLSENADFSNPRYLDFEKESNVSFNLKPGTYYWKTSNNLINGLKKEFVIESEVGMKINEEGDEMELENIGNVKINVTKNKEGIMVGHIILEPDQLEEIENEGIYIGRQEE